MLKPRVTLRGIFQRRFLLKLFLATVCFDLFLWYFDLRLGALDCKLFYSAKTVYSLFEAQGSSGRYLYKIIESFDLLFILLYSTLLTSVLLAFRRIWKLPLFLGIVPGIFDYGETAGILAMLLVYPDRHLGIAHLVSLCTPLKWLTLFGSLTLFAVTALRTGVWNILAAD
jgi:hypothetical protein